MNDGKVKIYGHDNDGVWEKLATFSHKARVNSATFGPDGCHLITVSRDSTSKIIGLSADGSWVEKATISFGWGVESATFSTDCGHVLTNACGSYESSYNKVKIIELRKMNN
ncbi:hypothetical protein [Endozoicomonas sp. ALC066]|uniref:hypothetical protein n=1 Tax=Endozoicomonas sp. ALC066 TaxID=3403078 RepID=UPI003BB5BA98